MKLYFTLAALLLITGCAQTQTFESCSFNGPLFYRAERGAHFKGSLQKFFEAELKNEFPDSEVTFQVHLLVDSTGKVCLKALEKDNPNISSANLKACISKMPDWIPARQNHVDVYFQADLVMHFKGGKLELTYPNEYPAPAPPTIVKKDNLNHPDITKDSMDSSTWKLWNVANSNLTNNVVQKVVMDQHGIIWCSTINSIIRIDGEKWQIFDGENTPILAGPRKRVFILNLDIDKDNNVWALGYGEVFRYDGQNWTKYDNTNSPLTTTLAIHADRKGISFCFPGGLIRFDGANWTSFTAANSPLTSAAVVSTYLDKKETLWVATTDGLFQLSNGNWHRFESNALLDQRFTFLTGDSNDNIWIGCDTKEVHYLVKIDGDGNISSFPVAGTLSGITIDPNTKKIWLPTTDAGLLIFDGTRFKKFDATNSPIHNQVTSVLVDRDGNKWISAFGGLLFTNKK